MLNKLTKHTKAIILIMSVVFALLLLLTFIFSDAQNKYRMIVISLFVAVIVYAFMRLVFRAILPNMSYEAMRFYFYFFILVPLFTVVLQLVSFITSFPNGLSPAFGGCIGCIFATLHTASKI